ncbi:hypothetical protein [Candidatus Phytoplasma meliae]|uniref:Uncharacterized protein n=1 Tax=Candidatus Phytoplasma meliae TaxID=1848402 RepID=A0ABS5CYZ5_9MOLU|nr:hypothetical protein [Candidatus Phytoplasma meliae]MBP5835794.1 hypothetical protein [Candidatus Phytoplasma meliae]MBP5836195.1 hypothetical protein [Candidatus Phytoplasma meliae]
MNNEPSFPYHNNIASTTIEFQLNESTNSNQKMQPLKPEKKNLSNELDNDELKAKLLECKTKEEICQLLLNYGIINLDNRHFVSFKNPEQPFNPRFNPRFNFVSWLNWRNSSESPLIPKKITILIRDENDYFVQGECEISVAPGFSLTP